MNIQKAKVLILANPPRKEKSKPPHRGQDFVPFWADDGGGGPDYTYAIDEAVEAIEDAVSEVRSSLDFNLGYVWFNRYQQFLLDVNGLASTHRVPKSTGISPLVFRTPEPRMREHEIEYEKYKTLSSYTPYILSVLDAIEEFAQAPEDLPSQEFIPDPDPGMQALWGISNRFKKQYGLYTQNRPPRLDFRAVKADWERLSDLCLHAISPKYKVRNQSEIFSHIFKAMSEIPYTWQEMKGDFEAKPEAVHKALLREFLSELNVLGPDRFGPHETDQKWFDLTVQRGQGMKSKSQIIWDLLSTFKAENP